MQSRMNLNNAFDIWLNHINSILIEKNVYCGKSLNGFKKGAQTKEAYDFILNHFNINEIKINEMELFIFRLFKTINGNNLSAIAYLTLKSIIEKQKILNKTLNMKQTEALNLVFEVAKSKYTNMELEDDFDEEINKSKSQNELELTDEELNILNSNVNPSEEQQLIIMETQISPQLNHLNQEKTNHETLSNNNTQINTTEQSTDNNSDLQHTNSNDLMKLVLNKLDQLTIQVNDLKSTQKNNNFETLEPNERNYDNFDLNALKRIIGYRIKKILICDNTIKIQEEHIRNGTIPKQLLTINFPIPFKKTTRFLNKFNNIIKDCQNKIINSIIEDTKETIIEIKKDIEKIKFAINKILKNENQLNKLISDIYALETNKLKKNFNKSIKKTENSFDKVATELYKQEINDDEITILDKSTNSLNESTNSSSKSSYISNKSNKVKFISKKNSNKFINNREKETFNHKTKSFQRFNKPIYDNNTPSSIMKFNFNNKQNAQQNLVKTQKNFNLENKVKDYKKFNNNNYNNNQFEQMKTIYNPNNIHSYMTNEYNSNEISTYNENNSINNYSNRNQRNQNFCWNSQKSLRR